MRERLHRALSVVYGIESYIVLKDIWNVPDREVERIALWMADALIDAALRANWRDLGLHILSGLAGGAVWLALAGWALRRRGVLP